MRQFRVGRRNSTKHRVEKRSRRTHWQIVVNRIPTIYLKFMDGQKLLVHQRSVDFEKKHG